MCKGALARGPLPPHTHICLRRKKKKKKKMASTEKVTLCFLGSIFFLSFFFNLVSHNFAVSNEEEGRITHANASS